MTVADIRCGACGSPLDSPTCASCGETAALPAWAGRAPSEGAGTTVCPACGHRNARAEGVCASCGTALGGKSLRPREGGSKTARGTGLWKIGAIAGAAALLLALLIPEFNRSAPPPPGRPAVPMEEIRSLQAAAEANPGDASSLLRLANRLHDAGLSRPDLLPAAIDAYRRYLILHPSDPDARVDLGICCFELGRSDSAGRAELFRTAIAEMEAARASSPKHQAAAFNLGIVHLTMGNAEDAAAWFRKAVDDAPGSDLAKRARSLLEQHGDPGSAQ